MLPLGLTVNGGLSFGFGWSFELGFGVSNADGFFIDTSRTDEIRADMQLNVVELGHAGQDWATGSLGFLKATVNPISGP